MVNDGALPIEELHFTRAPGVSITALEIPNSTLELEDDDFGFYIYQLEQPLQPGDKLKVSFRTEWLTPGFMNNGASMKLTKNGTFFNNLVRISFKQVKIEFKACKNHPGTCSF